MTGKLISGRAVAEITPKDSQFLFGYPHVERYSTGVHDPLFSSALYLSDGRTQILFITNDVIFVPREMSHRVRARIEKATGIPAGNIMITATHTHSGPITVDYLSNEADTIVPKADVKYLQYMEDAIFTAALYAYESALPAKIGLGIANADGIGTNRRDPAGPADLEVPVLVVTSADQKKINALMLVCCMHPTVLHEDSTLVSGDFPGMARRHLQARLGANCPILHHTGPEGNQSPRHVTKGNTFDEANRLGAILARAVEAILPNLQYPDTISLAAEQRFVELLPRQFPTVEQAEEKLRTAVAKLKHLRETQAPRADIRTAECDWFGAEETLTLARAAKDGRLEEARNKVMPAEIQVFQVGEWKFVAWPGEMFIEYDLAVKEKSKNTFVIALANGELQGYIVTPQAEAEGGYEAANALFAAQSGQRLVDTTLEMLNELQKKTK